MSYDLSLDDAPPPVSTTLNSPGVDAVAPEAPETPESPLPELLELTETFGGDFTGFSSVDDAKRAALLIAQSYAQAGSVAPAHSPQRSPDPISPSPVEEEEEDFGDLDLKVVARLKKLDSELKQTRAESRQFQERLVQEQSVLQQQQNKDVLDRALGAIDALADPRYGVGGNQNFTQQIARENLLRTADRIIQGMVGAGKNPPTIEKLINMAVLAESGKLPAAKAAAGGKGAPPAPVAGGSQQQIPAGVSHRKTGGEIDSYLGDKDYMAGARAILARGRR